MFESLREGWSNLQEWWEELTPDSQIFLRGVAVLLGVFLAGEVDEASLATITYATHHRHSCIGARAGFGDLLIGGGALMIEANGLDPDRHGHIRDAMVELITVVESFFACGVAASVYGVDDGAGGVMPDPVFANIGKLLLATKIYDMHRLAHYVSGGLIVALPSVMLG